MPVPLAIAAMAVNVAQSSSAARAQNKAAEIQQSQARGQAVRERREIVRQARIRRAQMINQATLTGSDQTSSAVSAGSNLYSQAASNLSASFANQALSAQATAYLGRANMAQRNANIAGQIGSFAVSQIGPKPQTLTSQDVINKNWGYNFKGDPFSG